MTISIGGGNGSEDSGVLSDCQAGTIVHNRETSFRRIEADVSKPILIPCARDQAIFSMYVLRGACCVSGDNQRLDLYGGQHALFRAPASTDFIVTPLDAPPLVAMVFQFSEAYLYRHCPENCPHLGYLMWANGRCMCQPLESTTPMVTTVEQRALIDQIWNAPISEYLRCVYRDVKVGELLVLQLCELLYGTKPRQRTGLREHELQRVYKVRDILRHAPGRSYTLLGLAHEVGTNDATLKRHFKQVVGCTVFAYLNSCRMAKAREMLVGERKTVAEIALCLGYKHVSHFSASFRKYFGSAPTKFRE